jgi:uncharacterized protein
MSVRTARFPRLDIGGRTPLFTRHEAVSHLTLGRRLLFASDLHLRKGIATRVIDQLLDIVLQTRPEVILLGGDLVDWRSGLEPLEHLIQEMIGIAPVGAVSGNHDRWVGVSNVREAVLNVGGHWLEDQPLCWENDAVVYGRSIQTKVPARCQILCTHGPKFPISNRTFDLILGGHLHGGQFVFFQRGGRFYPGAFAYRWNGLRFEENGSTLLVSRGVRDTVPLRWNCPREVIVVDL